MDEQESEHSQAEPPSPEDLARMRPPLPGSERVPREEPERVLKLSFLLYEELSKLNVPEMETVSRELLPIILHDAKNAVMRRELQERLAASAGMKREPFPAESEKASPEVKQAIDVAKRAVEEEIEKRSALTQTSDLIKQMRADAAKEAEKMREIEKFILEKREKEKRKLLLEKEDGVVVSCALAFACFLLIPACVLPIKLLMDYWPVVLLVGLSVPIGRFMALAYLIQKHR